MPSSGQGKNSASLNWFLPKAAPFGAAFGIRFDSHDTKKEMHPFRVHLFFQPVNRFHYNRIGDENPNDHCFNKHGNHNHYNNCFNYYGNNNHSSLCRVSNHFRKQWLSTF